MTSKNDWNPIKHAIIAGGGKFGLNIAWFFLKRGYKILIVDPRENPVVASIISTQVTLEHLLDGVGFINNDAIHVIAAVEDIFPRVFDLGLHFEWLAPAAPVNVMAKITMNMLQDSWDIRVDNSNLRQIASCIEKRDEYWTGVFPETGLLVMSKAFPGEQCPSTCMGQQSTCAHDRPIATELLHSRVIGCIERLLPKAASVILESRQLGPGIGAIKWKDLVCSWNLLKRLNQAPLAEIKLIAGSSCNCHGVITAFTVSQT
ncbi:hypothetical protein GF325_11540 [Candidatus Bathyarchaeota archaeon]|nr:hypothetical protein [Candidatus Bathyarchaeota archaeon]